MECTASPKDLETNEILAAPTFVTRLEAGAEASMDIERTPSAVGSSARSVEYRIALEEGDTEIAWHGGEVRGGAGS